MTTVTPFVASHSGTRIMQTATQYDVFVVLAHVDGNVLHEFIPAWVQMDLAKQPRDMVSGSPDSFHVLSGRCKIGL